MRELPSSDEEGWRSERRGGAERGGEENKPCLKSTTSRQRGAPVLRSRLFRGWRMHKHRMRRAERNNHPIARRATPPEPGGELAAIETSRLQVA
jgi:hypothetical protein